MDDTLKDLLQLTNLRSERALRKVIDIDQNKMLRVAYEISSNPREIQIARACANKEIVELIRQYFSEKDRESYVVKTEHDEETDKAIDKLLASLP